MERISKYFPVRMCSPAKEIYRERVMDLRTEPTSKEGHRALFEPEKYLKGQLLNRKSLIYKT